MPEPAAAAVRDTESTGSVRSRRAEICDAALSVFAERGYHGTSMEEIARVVGMRASSLYNHVSSKQELLAGIMVATMRDLLADDVQAALEDLR